MKNNEDVFIKKLENLDMPEIKVSKHGQILRSRLLSSAYFKRSNFTYFSRLQNYFLHIKNLINNSLINNSMNQKKKFAFGGALVVFALVAVVGFSNVPSFSNGGFSKGGNVAYAQAQELVKKSYTTATLISPEMRAKIEATIGVDMLSILKEASAASDLKIMTQEEIPDFTPVNGEAEVRKGVITKINSAVETTKEENGVSLSMVVPAAKFMSYTNPKMERTIIGLSQDDTLVFASIESAGAIQNN